MRLSTCRSWLPAAKKEGLDKSDFYKKQMAYLELKALRNEFFRAKVESAVTEGDMKALMTPRSLLHRQSWK